MAEICAGAILTQNTAWTNVEKALAGLQGAGLLPAERIADCRLPRLAELIRPSGYYRQKARRLRDFFARARGEHPEGLRRWFLSAPAEELRRELLSYKGVGPETADSIVLYAAGLPSFVIDAYTRRIGERVGLGRGRDYDRWKSIFEKQLPRRADVYNEYHALLVRLAKERCRKTAPLCPGCPLKKECAYASKKRKDHGKDRSSARQGRIQKSSRRP
jgi:endonuclease-3 related protein